MSPPWLIWVPSVCFTCRGFYIGRVSSPCSIVCLHVIARLIFPQAVAVFLTMLFLGLKNIKLGPQLPAFLTPNVLQILADTYGVKQVNLADHDADLKEMIARTPR